MMPALRARRPFVPWNECCVCWGGDDKRHLLRCTHCNDAYHTYCLEPPLEEVRGRTPRLLPIASFTCAVMIRQLLS